jgi:hypothetical protein
MGTTRFVEDNTRTSSDFIAKSNKGIFCGRITPPTLGTVWNIGGHLEAKGRETR